MKLREILVYCDSGIEREREFNLEANVISSLFFQCLRNTEIDRFKKVAIKLFQGSDEFNKGLKIELAPGNILWIILGFDFISYWKLPLLERKKIILEVIRKAINQIIDKGYKLPAAEFDLAYEKVIELNYNRQFYWGKIKHSNESNIGALIKVVVEAEYARIIAVFFDENMEVLSEMDLFKSLPDNMYLSQLLGKTKWYKNGNFELTDKSGEIHFAVNDKQNEVHISLSPKKISKKQLENNLLIWYADTNDDVRNAVLDKILYNDNPSEPNYL